jgi:hypothetical protein
MNYLVDTNILTRLADPAHATHQQAVDAVKRLAHQGHKLHIVPQNLYEFWVVCTRPKNVNGLARIAILLPAPSKSASRKRVPDPRAASSELEDRSVPFLSLTEERERPPWDDQYGCCQPAGAR